MITATAFCDDAGHFSVDNREQFLEDIRKEFLGKSCVVTVESPATLRSKKANAYYWSVVVKAGASEGESEEAVHAMWCQLFLPSEAQRLKFYNRLTGEKIVMEVDPRRSSKLSGEKFYTFVEQCRLWCQEWLGVTTPDPDPEYWRKRPAKDNA